VLNTDQLAPSLYAGKSRAKKTDDPTNAQAPAPEVGPNGPFVPAPGATPLAPVAKANPLAEPGMPGASPFVQ
jgi:hypothetical protein